MPSTALKKIITRAKKIRKIHKSMTWKSAVKKASAEYNSGKIGSARKSHRQTGTSVKKKDAKRKAKAPGKRRSRTGRTYIERRKNRSDVPGKLTGVSVPQLRSAMRSQLNEKLGKAMVQQYNATTSKTYNGAKNRISEIKRSLRGL